MSDEWRERQRQPSLEGREPIRLSVRQIAVRSATRVDVLADQRYEPVACFGRSWHEHQQARIGLRIQPQAAPIRDALQLFC